MPRFKLILFDADNTLFDFNLSQELAFLNTLTHLNVFSTDEEKRRAVYTMYREHGLKLWKDYEEGVITREFLRSERFLILNRHFDLDLEPQSTSDLYLKLLSLQGHLMDDAVYVCKKLKKLGIAVGIVTNGAEVVQRPRLALSPLSPFIDFMITSEEAGQPKPHPLIFEMSLARANVSDKSVVCMVGDSLSADVRGGNRFGITTCWFNPYRVGPEYEADCRPHFEVQSLKDLLGRI